MSNELNKKLDEAAVEFHNKTKIIDFKLFGWGIRIEVYPLRLKL